MLMQDRCDHALSDIAALDDPGDSGPGGRLLLPILYHGTARVLFKTRNPYSTTTTARTTKLANASGSAVPAQLGLEAPALARLEAALA
jgi:hypothetical protein